MDLSNAKITAYSENAQQMLDTASDCLLGRTLKSVDAGLAGEIGGLAAGQEYQRVLLERRFAVQGTEFELVTHLQGNIRIIEFLPASKASSKETRQNALTCSDACIRILQADDFQSALDVALEAVRKISGQDHIELVQLRENGSSDVIAVSRCSETQTKFDQRIPWPGTNFSLPTIVPLRPFHSVGQVEGKETGIVASSENAIQTSLSHCLSAPVSCTHKADLKNIGAASFFACSLMQEDQHWGAITGCSTTPRVMGFHDSLFIEQIGAALMLFCRQAGEKMQAELRVNLQDIEQECAHIFRQPCDVESLLNQLAPVLQKAAQADGFAFQYGSKLIVSGQVPPISFISQLATWAKNTGKSAQLFQTQQLFREWAPAAENIPTACGVLIRPLFLKQICQLIWFRAPAPTIQECPTTPMDATVQESDSWSAIETEKAAQAFDGFIDKLAVQMMLKEENVHLRNFADTAAHDLKAPLRGISMALEMMREEEFDMELVRDSHQMAEICAQRMIDLTNGLLELAVIREETHEFSLADLNLILKDAHDMLQPQIKEAAAEFTFHPLPVLPVIPGLVSRLFLNLFSNALKYRAPDKPILVDVCVIRETDSFCDIAVSDTGIGIAVEHFEHVFQPMKRLHAKDTIEGTGLGLTICERIAAIHQGALWLDPDYTDGARFVVRLAKYHDLKHP